MTHLIVKICIMPAPSTLKVLNIFNKTLRRQCFTGQPKFLMLFEIMFQMRKTWSQNTSISSLMNPPTFCLQPQPRILVHWPRFLWGSVYKEPIILRI